jgi:hypothetical protein
MRGTDENDPRQNIIVHIHGLSSNYFLGHKAHQGGIAGESSGFESIGTAGSKTRKVKSGRQKKTYG